MLTTVVLRVDQRIWQVIQAALDELPGKVSREIHQNLTLQVQDQLYAHEQQEQKRVQDEEQCLREKIKEELNGPKPEEAS
jgi:hypothetical protein